MILSFIFIFGIIIGSFLNVVILRLPREQALTGRSHCVNCGHVLAAWELVPLFSYLLLRGQCRKCGKKISPRYFIIEAVTALLFVLGYVAIVPTTVVLWVKLLEWLLLAAVGLVVFVIDLEHYLIFDVIIFPALIIVLVLSLTSDLAAGTSLISWSSHVANSLLGAVAGSLPFFLVWWLSGGKWMGFGDIKLMLLIGAATGLTLVPVAVMLAVFGGGLFSVGLLLFTKKTLKSQVPFGTFLTAAMLVTLLWGPNLLHWYLALLGY